MTRADFSPPRSTRLGVTLVVVLLHIALVVALVRAFAPTFTARIAEQVFDAVTVTVTTPPPEPPKPAPDAKPRVAELSGEAAEAGKRATPKPVAAPSPHIVIAPQQAVPPVAGQGGDVTAGARDTGTGTGAGGQGNGTGSGASGNGTGGGGSAVKAVKIAGDINSARDYPPETRALRLGGYVIVALTIGTDGHVRDCRIHRASQDPQADQITCRLATQRFRFRPATDAAGNPVESTYGWQQRWFEPSEKKMSPLGAVNYIGH